MEGIKISKEFKSDINAIIEDIPEPGKKGATIKFINNMFKNHNITYEQLGYLVGRIFINQPGFFMRDIYPTWLKLAPRFLPLVHLFEMERYILETFCLLPGETFIESFPGKVIISPVEFKGRIYVTSERIIANAKMGSVTMSRKSLAGTIALAAFTGLIFSRPKFKHNFPKSYIQKVLLPHLPTALKVENPARYCFGHTFPWELSYFYKTTKSNYFHVSMGVEIQKGIKQGYKNFEMVIAVDKLEEDSKEYYAMKVEDTFSELSKLVRKKTSDSLPEPQDGSMELHF